MPVTTTPPNTPAMRGMPAFSRSPIQLTSLLFPIRALFQHRHAHDKVGKAESLFFNIRLTRVIFPDVNGTLVTERYSPTSCV